MGRLRHLESFVLGLSSLLAASCGAGGVATRDIAPDHVVIDASASLARIAADQLGTNLQVAYDVTAPSLPSELAQLHAHLLRWPGGSLAETYHWQNHTQCDGHVSKPAYDPRSTFRNFMNDIVMPGGYDVAVTVAYGTNPTCTGGGDPREAAAWVAYARSHGYSSRIKFWTVGNESFGNWEVDLHAKPHDPKTYAAAVSGPTGYYALMKAADPRAQVGVIVAGNDGYDDWDRYVLSHAPYDFIEVHWYAEQPGEESDSYLLDRAPQDFSRLIHHLERELAAAGRPNTPIVVGEVNSVAYNQGKQSVSIVNGLFAGQVLAEGIEDGLAADAWWFGVGGIQDCGIHNPPGLYGFQDWGSYDLIFGNTRSAYNDCQGPNGGHVIAEGALSPSGHAFRLVAEFANPGERLLSTASGSADARAYAATQGKGYAVLLFNLSETKTKAIHITIRHADGPAYAATEQLYGKAQYDESRHNVWAGAVTEHLGSVGDSFTLTLPPWSMSLLQLQRNTATAVPQ